LLFEVFDVFFGEEVVEEKKRKERGGKERRVGRKKRSRGWGRLKKELG